MANTPLTTPPGSRPRQTSLVRIIAIVLLALIILVGLAVLIIWLAVRPRKLVYTIESGSIHSYNLSHDQFTATFNFQVRAYNPNSKVSIYYDRVEAKVSYDDASVAFNNLQPFYQGHRNVTRLGINLVAKNVSLYPGVATNLRMEKNSGQIEFEVRLKAKIRFKVGSWKSRHRTLRILCTPVMVPISTKKNFEMVPCDVDL